MSEDKDLLEKEKQGREASDENMKEDEYEKVCFLCRRPESKTEIGRASCRERV